MSLPTKTLAWTLQNRVADGRVDFSDSPSATFKLVEKDLPSESELSSTALFVQTVYIGNDAGQLLYISTDERVLSSRAAKRMPGLPKDSTMWAFTVSRVLKVGGATGSEGDDKFKEGDLVLTMGVWAYYAVVEKGQANVVQ